MKTTKLIAGILMIVLSVFIFFQSMVAGLGDALADNGGTSEGSGLIFAILFLTSGIVYIVNKSKTSLVSDIVCMVMLLIAWIIGITMSGVYGDLIIWSWLAFIIGVGFFVWHLMTNKNKGNTVTTPQASENNAQSKKPFYKKWWVWLVAVIAVFFVFVAVGGNSNKTSESDKTVSKASGHKTTASEKGSSSQSASSKITVSYKDYKVASQKTYDTNYSDTGWSPAAVTVKKVVIYKLAKPYKYESANDGTFQITGFVRMYYTIKANRDISIYPSQGTYVYSNGEQHEADVGEGWDGDISSGATKTGTVEVPVKDTSNISTIRSKFDANYDTSNYDDDNANHTYDFTINLQ
ncbi:hypothetical protein [Liquorilactobacillus nagelii]|uniref:hypothetical protein n=1 Tax=Liquorilactobacillus nagelii TaxID=82688 RepID=UPI0039ED15BC